MEVTIKSKYNILIVDDSPMMRNGLKMELRPLNLKVSEASNGREGLELALKKKFDLIVTDVDMPEIDGVEFCKELKKTPSTQRVPVLMISSFDSDEDIERGFQVGATAYIPKEEAKSKLREAVTNILSEATLRKKQVILIVDDSPTIIKIVKTGLIQAGFRVLTANDGSEALKVMKEHRPDLILSDIDMPVMDGFKLCKAIKSESGFSGIPFVVMSANNQRGTMKRMLQYGAVAYITKPFNTDQLVILLEKILSDHFLLLLKEKERLDVEQDLMIGSIMSLVSALEARDKYTKGHSEKVAEILTGMASLLGEPDEKIEKMAIGGKLHDIGKIGIRDNILLKPGALTRSEYDHIKQHPIIGAKILESNPSLSDIVEIVLYHHERMDGKGYPKGLKGEDIPLWARMTAVADTFSALTSDRPYRKGLPVEQALQIIVDVKGSQLCPDCVDLFLKWMNA